MFPNNAPEMGESLRHLGIFGIAAKCLKKSTNQTDSKFLVLHVINGMFSSEVEAVPCEICPARFGRTKLEVF